MSGGSEWADDPSIGDDEVVWRRVPPLHQETDEAGNVRPRSGAFCDSSSSPMSVDLGTIAGEPAVTRGVHLDAIVVEFVVGELRRLGQGIHRMPIGPNDPSGDAENPAHAYVVGAKGKGVRRKLKALARVVLLAADE